MEQEPTQEELKQRLRDATERASEKLSAMTYEERRAACEKAYLMFTQKKNNG